MVCHHYLVETEMSGEKTNLMNTATHRNVCDCTCVCVFVQCLRRHNQIYGTTQTDRENNTNRMWKQPRRQLALARSLPLDVQMLLISFCFGSTQYTLKHSHSLAAKETGSTFLWFRICESFVVIHICFPFHLCFFCHFNRFYSAIHSISSGQ